MFGVPAIFKGRASEVRRRKTQRNNHIYGIGAHNDILFTYSLLISSGGKEKVYKSRSKVNTIKLEKKLL